MNATDGHNQVERKVLDWVDYYNNERYQWSLAKLSPTEYCRYVTTGEYSLPVNYSGGTDADGGSAPNPQSFTLLFPGKTKKKTKPKLRLPCKPDIPLGSLSSLTLSCMSVKQLKFYHTSHLKFSNNLMLSNLWGALQYLECLVFLFKIVF